MFEDHWYDHSTATLQEFATASLRRSDSIKRQQDQARALEKTTLRNVVKQPPAELQKRKPRGLPQPTVRRRANSCSSPKDLTTEEYCLLQDQTPLLEPAPGSPPYAQVPVRPKSSNALYDHHSYAGKNDKRHKMPKDLQDELDLIKLYESYEDELQDASNYEYKLFCSTLQSYLWTCQSLLSTTDSTLELLSSLKTSFLAVRNQTASFESQCEDLLAEEKRLDTLVHSIGRGLAPFGELDGIVRKLNKPGTEFVKTRGFADMLKTLDWCLEDLEKYPNFKDTPTYLPRFRQCMTRALTLIRNYLVSALREIQTDVSKRIAAKGMNETAQSALLYAKFRLNAPEVRDLAGEIEKRCAHEEYIALLQECYVAFFQIRKTLLFPILAKRVTELSTANADLVSFARSSISYVKSICWDESELFFAYFSSGEQDLYTYLELVCAPLIDQLRPRVAREVHLIKLCELCTLLQTRYTRDPEEAEGESQEKSHIDFGRLIQTVLQDTQTRLVARAQVVVKDEIDFFAPSADDLDYPTKAKLLAKDSKPFGNGAEYGGGQIDNVDPTDLILPGWFPTLRKAIWLLSRIYRLVNPTIFGDIAHRVVHSCTVSLIKASQLLYTQKSPVDSQLFLIKHLLILKEQIVAFDIEYLPLSSDTKQEETLSGTFWDVYMKGELLTRDGILRLVSTAMPKAVNNMIDAKVELDANLRKVITQFTGEYAHTILPQIVSTVWEQQNPMVQNIHTPTAQVHLPALPQVNILSPLQQPPSRSASPLPSLPSLSSLPTIPFLSSAARSLSRSTSPAPPPQVGTGSVKSSTSSHPVHRIISSPVHPQRTSSLPLVTSIEQRASPTVELSLIQPNEIISQIETSLPHTISTIRAKIAEYMFDTRTRETLVGAVLEAILNRYEKFYGVLEKMTRSEQNAVERTIALQKSAELWHPDRLAMWVEGVANEGWRGSRGRGVDGVDGAGDEVKSQGSFTSEEEEEQEQEQE